MNTTPIRRPGRPGQRPAKTDRLIPFDGTPDLAKLLVQIGETRLVLNRALQGTAASARDTLQEVLGAIREIRALAERANHLLGLRSANERSPASPSPTP